MQMLKRMAKWKNRERLADPSTEPYVLYQASEESQADFGAEAAEFPVTEQAAAAVGEKAAILAP
jgi:hypothetical protein